MCGAPRWARMLLILTLSVNALDIETPNNVAACATTLISWTGGTGPYQLQVVPGTHVNVTTSMRVLQSAISGTSFQWNVDVRAGKNIALICQDATQTQVATNAFTVQANTGCSPQQGQGNSPSGQPETQGSASSSQSQSSSSLQLTPGTSGSSYSSSSSSSSSFFSTSTQSGVSTLSTSVGQTDLTASTSSSDRFGATASTTDVSPTNSGLIPSGANSNIHRSIVGPVVGSICAFVAVLLAIFLLLYCRHRRHTRQTGTLSIGSPSLQSSSMIIEPFLSPASPSSLPSPWYGRPSKYGLQHASSPPPPPSPSNSSSSRTNVLTTDQVNLVQQLCNLQVPAAAVTQVIDRMLLHPGDASAETDRVTPPAYE